MISVLLLAAGASRRMRGRDKLFELVDERPLLTRQIEMIQGLTDRLYITLPSLVHPRAALLTPTVTAIPVPDADTGLSASLKRGLSVIPANDDVMFLLADMPEIETNDLNITLQAFEKADNTAITRATTEDGQPGHPIIIPASTRPLFENLKGDNGGREILNTADTILVPLKGNRARLDLDTPEDWQNWRNETGR